jgi:hypothetical protein
MILVSDKQEKETKRKHYKLEPPQRIAAAKQYILLHIEPKSQHHVHYNWRPHSKKRDVYEP